MADQLIAVMEGLGTRVNSLATALSGLRTAGQVPTFKGEPELYTEWIKAIEKQGLLEPLNDEQTKRLAFQSAAGPVSDYLQRILAEQAGITWAQLKRGLAARFGDVTDNQHALTLLRKIKQRADENIQVFAERLLTLSAGGVSECSGRGGPPDN